ncbi:unnamed protein product [Microthlaspi erraticum]|uniref:Reverse transcriptase Ty1/copia-type domain-containing protein n=1 Tax=Microthlaspi erraticum TaxID=1685480 RepID=A0A6D2L524_9BRAS|nr:unnamed protein product [Microthlaspi erraticum]
MDIFRDRKKGKLVLSQKDYLSKVIKTFGMCDAKTVQTPVGSQFKLHALTEDQPAAQSKFMDDIPYSSAVGSLMYAMVGLRPDLAYVVGLVSRYMGNPRRDHWKVVQLILRYVKGAANTYLTFTKESDFKVKGYCDSDYAADRDKSRSISEAEYMSLSEAVREAIWLKGVCEEWGFKQNAVEVHCDSQSAIYLAKNNMFHERTKHVATKVHFIRDIIAQRDLKVMKIHTSKNPADMLTKVLPGNKFEDCLKTLKEHGGAVFGTKVEDCGCQFLVKQEIEVPGSGFGIRPL